MSNIINFPHTAKKEAQAPYVTPATNPRSDSKVKRFLRGTIKCAWMIAAITRPITRWIVRLDLLFAFLRMAFHVTPYAGWEFIAHGAIAATLAWFVIFYRSDETELPKKQPKNNGTTGNQNKRRRS